MCFSWVNRRRTAALFLTLVAVGLALLADASVRNCAGIAALGAATAWLIGSNNKLLHLAILLGGISLVVVPTAIDWRDAHTALREYTKRVNQFEGDFPELAKAYPLKVEFNPQQQAKTPQGPWDKYAAQAPGQTTPRTNDWFAAHAPQQRQPHLTQSPNSRIGAGPVQLDFERAVPLFRVSSYSELQSLLVQIGYTAKQQEQLRNGLRESFAAGKLAINQSMDLPAIIRTDHQFMADNTRRISVEFERDADSFFDPVPDWYRKAVEAGINVTQVPPTELPGDEPEPFSLLHSLAESFLFTIPGAVAAIGGGLLLVFIRRERPAKGHQDQDGL
jgi:hypothetical protein